MEALVSLLTLLHNERFNSHTLDNSNTSCRNTCPSHKFFHLSILEELNCECGLKKEIPWNYSSFVHPFYVSSILEKAQEVDSKDLIRIREEDLEDYLEHSSLLSVEGQLPEFMKNQWEGLKEDLCSCLFGRTSKKMMVQNEPEVYLIQLVWNNSMPSALEILQVLASLPYTLSLDRIYLNGTQTKYNLRGMILYGCGHYIYCHRIYQEWFKLEDELSFKLKKGSWKQLIDELLSSRFYPVGLFYYKESSSETPEISFLDWLKLERNLGLPRNSWVCSCGQTVSESFNACQNCKNLKPGTKGWLCKTCTFLNDVYEIKCKQCGEFKQTNHSTCKDCRKYISSGTYCNECLRIPNRHSHSVTNRSCIRCGRYTSLGVYCDDCMYGNKPQKTFERPSGYPSITYGRASLGSMKKLCDNCGQDSLTLYCDNCKNSIFGSSCTFCSAIFKKKVCISCLSSRRKCNMCSNYIETGAVCNTCLTSGSSRRRCLGCSSLMIGNNCIHCNGSSSRFP